MLLIDKRSEWETNLINCTLLFRPSHIDFKFAKFVDHHHISQSPGQESKFERVARAHSQHCPQISTASAKGRAEKMKAKNYHIDAAFIYIETFYLALCIVSLASVFFTVLLSEKIIIMFVLYTQVMFINTLV